MGDVYGKLVGKYTIRPMDPSYRNQNHSIATFLGDNASATPFGWKIVLNRSERLGKSQGECGNKVIHRSEKYTVYISIPYTLDPKTINNVGFKPSKYG